MKIQEITRIEQIPLRSETANESEYRQKVEAFLVSIKTLTEELGITVPQMNGVAQDLNTVANLQDILFASTHYTGEHDPNNTYSKGESVSKSNNIYISKEDGNITTPPGAKWLNPMDRLVYCQANTTATNIASDSVYPLDNVVVDRFYDDTGSSYGFNTDSHSYTVPEDGLYKIIVTGAIGNTDKDVYWYTVRVNGTDTRKLRLDTSDNHYADIGALILSENLQQGDVVDIYFLSRNGSEDYGNEWLQFIIEKIGD